MFLRVLENLENSFKHFNKLLTRSVVRKIHTNVRKDEVLSTIVRHGAIRVSLLRKYLNCSFEDAISIVKSNPAFLFEKNNAEFEDQLSFFIEILKLDPKTLITNSRLLYYSGKTVQNRILILEDYGFAVSDSNLIVDYATHITKTPQYLISCGILKSDPVNHLLVSRSVEDYIAEGVRNKFKKSVYFSYPLNNIHKLLIRILLELRLECSRHEACMLIEKEPILVSRSFTTLNKILTILIEKIQFPKSQIKSNTCILKCNLRNLQKCLEQPAIGSTDTVERIRSEPSILLFRGENIEKLNEVYKRYLITEEQQRSKYAYRINAESVEQLLANFGDHKELQALKYHPNFIKVLAFMSHAEANMEKLKSRGMVSWSLKKLLCPAKQLDRVLFYSSDRCRGNEAVLYLAKTLDKPQDAVRKRLKLHPEHSRVSFYNVQTVCDNVLIRGVSKEQVWNALPVVLYDCNVVMRILSELETYPELAPFEEWKSNPYLLRLLFYYIEKNNSFNFTGIYFSDKVTVDCEDF